MRFWFTGYRTTEITDWPWNLSQKISKLCHQFSSHASKRTHVLDQLHVALNLISSNGSQIGDAEATGIWNATAIHYCSTKATSSKNKRPGGLHLQILHKSHKNTWGKNMLKKEKKKKDVLTARVHNWIRPEMIILRVGAMAESRLLSLTESFLFPRDKSI